MTGRTESDSRPLGERLAAIEESISHIKRSVDRAEDQRSEVHGRITAVERDIHHIQRYIPEQVEKNTETNERNKGFSAAKEDSERDHRANTALLLSGAALVFSGLASLANLWNVFVP